MKTAVPSACLLLIIKAVPTHVYNTSLNQSSTRCNSTKTKSVPSVQANGSNLLHRFDKLTCNALYLPPLRLGSA